MPRHHLRPDAEHAARPANAPSVEDVNAELPKEDASSFDRIPAGELRAAEDVVDAAHRAAGTDFGVDPAELARRANGHARHGKLSPAALARWLVDAGFAVRRDGLLFPTELGLELGATLAVE